MNNELDKLDKLTNKELIDVLNEHIKLSDLGICSSEISLKFLKTLSKVINKQVTEIEELKKKNEILEYDNKKLQYQVEKMVPFEAMLKSKFHNPITTEIKLEVREEFKEKFKQVANSVTNTTTGEISLYTISPFQLDSL